MSRRIDIKDNRNIIIGYTEELSDRIQAYHLRKGYCGYYYKSQDITYDLRGKVYCYGDGTQSLIRDLERS